MIEMQEILHLSVAERLIIVEKIWDSIKPIDIEMPESHQQELDRRLSRYENGKTSFLTWTEIKDELINRK